MVYGDHQPSLPKALHALGVGSEQTDYVIWRTHPRGAGRTVDLSADELPAELIGAMDVDVRTTQRVSLA
jgi:hypothetical protein